MARATPSVMSSYSAPRSRLSSIPASPKSLARSVEQRLQSSQHLSHRASADLAGARVSKRSAIVQTSTVSKRKRSAKRLHKHSKRRRMSSSSGSSSSSSSDSSSSGNSASSPQQLPEELTTQELNDLHYSFIYKGCEFLKPKRLVVNVAKRRVFTIEDHFLCVYYRYGSVEDFSEHRMSIRNVSKATGIRIPSV